MVLAVAGGGKVHIWGSKSNLCRSLELSQASQAQPENLLPSVISSALTQMLQDPALCLTEREFCPWGGWQGTEPPPLLPSPALQTPTRPPPPPVPHPEPSTPQLLLQGGVFHRAQNLPGLPSLPPDTFSCQPDSHRAVCIKIRCKSLHCRNIRQIRAFVLSQA